ncbi:MAG: alpha/beta fold hydrolase [Gammaproteobacteria bacterium]
MNRALLLIAALACATSAVAQVVPFPATFKTQQIAANGVTLNTRVGGSGPAVLLLHGYGETGDMWGALAIELARDHTVIVPDLRGMGLSSRPAGGYDKKTQGQDMSALLDSLGVKQFDLVTHDIGNMVGYALAAEQRGRVTRFVIMDAPLPGVGPWDEILKLPLLWHFRFSGPEAEKIVKGRERTYLNRFWNEFSADPGKFSEASRAHYASLYAKPGAMHAGFAQFAAFDQDVIDNKAFMAAGKLTMPVLAVGGASSFGPMMATVMQFAAEDVHEKMIPGSGHWLMEENPVATVAAIRSFLDTAKPAAIAGPRGERRLTATEVDALARGGAGTGTSGVAGITTTILYGDPQVAGPYALEIRVPANTKIAAHTHRDARTAMVVSGTWFFGYGDDASKAEVKPLAAGGFYTEPSNLAHFAFTRESPATVLITGIGPSDTQYVQASAKSQ